MIGDIRCVSVRPNSRELNIERYYVSILRLRIQGTSALENGEGSVLRNLCCRVLLLYNNRFFFSRRVQ